ncbi:serine-threonine protein kinase [Streptomyces sp. NBC_01268]|uniref:serine-threonine protein kinase n=1 Tax=unclassified Streptomyces TaxID=2593676 RepID=UPI002E324266|nr:serine-threonine protein kinase [Streptomyces sp. NBC_01268]
MTGMSVGPYREITFDKDGDGPGGPAGQAARLGELARQGCTDLLVFAHGWNNSPSVATRFYSSFFAPFPGLEGPGVRLGYAGAVWPSMMFSDEPVPDFASLAATVPGKTAVVARLAELTGTEPARESAFAEFAALLRELTDTDRVGLLDPADADVPAFLVADPLTTYAAFAAAGEEDGRSGGGGSGGSGGSGGDAGSPEVSGAGGEALFGGDRVKRLWKGAKEALRQATYYTMKRRAGVVGARGLGPVLGELARTSPNLRVHLAGHSFGGRLVAHALPGLPDGTRTVKSVTLLQGAFSHYAFAARLPHAPGRGGSLPDLQHRVDGPLVACHSRHDTALRVFYPLASRLSRDDDALLGQDGRRWGALGYDGIQAVPGMSARTLGTVLRDGLPASGCVSVDAAEVVSEHSDVCHPELARVVARAGRFGG